MEGGTKIRLGVKKYFSFFFGTADSYFGEID